MFYLLSDCDSELYPTVNRDKIFEFLIDIASQSPAKKRKVGAAIAAEYGDKYIVYSTGYNFNVDGGPCETEDNVTHPNVQHAEVSAILNLDNNIRNTLPYDPIFMFTTCEPCAGCRAALLELKMRYKVVDKLYKQPKGKETMSDIDKTLKERGSRYGDFSDNAKISEQIIDFLRYQNGYENLRDVHRSALNVIAQKIARIVNGDPEYKDNWHDIAGYAKLAEDRCIKIKDN
jgi:deoxycytidylate deaminase